MSIVKVAPSGGAGAPAPVAPPPTTAPAAPVAPEKKPGDVDIDPAKLGEWARLSKSEREARTQLEATNARVAELEGKLAAAGKPSVKTLAEARALGIELEGIFAEWVEEGQTPGGAAPKELTTALDKLKALEETVSKVVEDRTKETETQKTERMKAIEAESDRLTGGFLDEDAATEAPKWPISARAENRAEASTEVRRLVTVAAKKIGRAVTDEEGDKIYRLALDEVEADFASRGARYSPGGARNPEGAERSTPRPAPVARETTTITNDRGTVRRPAAEAPRYTTFKDAKAEVLAKIKGRAGQRG